MSNTVKVKSVKVYVEHCVGCICGTLCESKVRGCVCRTLCESKVRGCIIMSNTV